MVKIALSTLFLLLLVILLMVGARQIPGIAVDGKFTDQFVFSGFLELLSFVVTALVIAPLVSGYVRWRENKEWESARVNACKRLNQGFSDVINSLNSFFIMCKSDRLDYARNELDLTRKNIIGFFESYDDEHPTFTAAMHSSASQVRVILSILLKQLDTTHRTVFRRGGYRVLVHRHELDKIRALFDKPRLKKAEEPTPLARNTFINEDEPIIIEEDPYFFSSNRLFFDFSLDRSSAEGTNYINRFLGVDFKSLKTNWDAFLASCPKKSCAKNPIDPEKTFAEDYQVRLYTNWIKSIVKDYADLFILLGEKEANKIVKSGALNQK